MRLGQSHVNVFMKKGVMGNNESNPIRSLSRGGIWDITLLQVANEMLPRKWGVPKNSLCIGETIFINVLYYASRIKGGAWVQGKKHWQLCLPLQKNQGQNYLNKLYALKWMVQIHLQEKKIIKSLHVRWTRP